MLCGCGSSTPTSGPTQAEWVYVATPNQGEPREFADKVIAEQYVAALGGGSVQSEQRQLAA